MAIRVPRLSLTRWASGYLSFTRVISGIFTLAMN
jgi:hypothetical protein